MTVSVTFRRRGVDAERVVTVKGATEHDCVVKARAQLYSAIEDRSRWLEYFVARVERHQA
jgi:hypothetical protein